MRLISLRHKNHIDRVECGFRTMVFPRGTQETEVVAEASGSVDAGALSYFITELTNCVDTGTVRIEICIDDTDEISHNVHRVIERYYRKQTA